ncbi:hypothetical protein FIBSPDRAFT_654883, partial [Athelia psychrophila]
SVLPALTCDGIMAVVIFKGTVNHKKFLRFLCDQVAPQLSPYPGPHSVAVLDNCSIHHN